MERVYHLYSDSIGDLIYTIRNLIDSVSYYRDLSRKKPTLNQVVNLMITVRNLNKEVDKLELEVRSGGNRHNEKDEYIVICEKDYLKIMLAVTKLSFYIHELSIIDTIILDVKKLKKRDFKHINTMLNWFVNNHAVLQLNIIDELLIEKEDNE